MPKKLTQALKGEISYKNAIDYYNSKHYILKKYSHIPLFKHIKNNSEKLIGDIKAAVLEKFDVQDVYYVLYRILFLLFILTLPARKSYSRLLFLGS
jgi:hypothetical protein